MRGRVLGAAALAAALAIGTTACGGGNPKPKPAESSGVGQSNEATRSDRAESAARTWIDTLNSASSSLQVDRLQELSSPSCDPCRIIITSITSISANGGYIRGGEWSPHEVKSKSLPNGDVQVDFQVAVQPQNVKEAPNSKVKVFSPQSRVPKRLLMHETSRGWLVLDLTQEDEL